MKNTDNTVTQVGCNVCSCEYHTEGHYCSAKHIDVANEKAERKAETFCSTFTSKDNGVQG